MDLKSKVFSHYRKIALKTWNNYFSLKLEIAWTFIENKNLMNKYLINS